MRQLAAQAPSLRIFDRLVGTNGGPVGVAVSGGSDSIALLHLAHDWAEASGRDLLALTFDHQLRAASADEAARVSGVCNLLGIAHETLRWENPVARQSAARRARHARLALGLKRAGGSVLLTGHTADDQAETFLMRTRHGSTWYGLAGMQAVSMSPVWPEGEGVRVARPLLGARRHDLRDMLRERRISWDDDPSNDNPAYERVRMRQLLAGAPELFTRISGIQAQLAGLRAIEDACLGRWLGDHVDVTGDGHITLDLAALSGERAARGIGLLIQCLTAREAPPRRENLQALTDRLRSSRPFAGATLGGAIVTRKGACVHLVPEVGPEQADPLLIQRISAWRALLSGKP